MSERLKVVQIGICHEHANGKFLTCQKMPETYELVGVVDERPWSTTPRFLDYGKLFENIPKLSLEETFKRNDIDLVFVEVPNLDLVPIAMQCMEHNLPMHLDKPAGTDLALYKTLLDGCKAKNLPLQMGYMFRGNPVFKFVKYLAENHAFGDIVAIDMDMDHCYGGDDYQEYIAKMPGGIMFNLGCHLIDFIVALLGEPTAVHSFLKNTPEQPSTVLNNTMAVLEYPMATATVRSCSRRPQNDSTGNRHMRIGGTAGCCELEPLERFDGKPLKLTMTLKNAVCGFQPGDYSIEFPPQRDRYIVQLQELADIVRGKGVSEYSYEHDYIVHKVSLQASKLL